MRGERGRERGNDQRKPQQIKARGPWKSKRLVGQGRSKTKEAQQSKARGQWESIGWVGREGPRTRAPNIRTGRLTTEIKELCRHISSRLQCQQQP